MSRLERWTPWVFVLIWSSGFVVAKYAFEYSDVLFFLGIRLLIAGGILLFITVALGQSLRLTRSQIITSLALGLTLQAIYLGGVWEAIANGSPLGIASVVTSTQPILVSILAFIILKERLLRNQITGLVLGFVGVVLVLSPSFSAAGERCQGLFAPLSCSTFYIPAGLGVFWREAKRPVNHRNCNDCAGRCFSSTYLKLGGRYFEFSGARSLYDLTQSPLVQL